MCGRYAASRDKATLVETFDTTRITDRELAADYNVAPTNEVYAVVERATRQQPVARELAVVRWGLVPSWARDPKIGSRMINARVETLAEKPAFRTAAAKRRCLLPADGYYEWYQPEAQAAPLPRSAKKQPFFIHPADGSVLAMAGLYEFWRDPDRPADDPASWLWTVTVITTTAPDDLGRIHDRMPMVVRPGDWATWLDPNLNDARAAVTLLRPATPGWLRADPVSTIVNNVRNNGPELLLPITDSR